MFLQSWPPPGAPDIPPMPAAAQIAAIWINLNLVFELAMIAVPVRWRDAVNWILFRIGRG